jgi:hypothetical protein
VAKETENANGSAGAGTALLNASQDAAELARTTVQRAGERLPETIATVQDAANETQRRIDGMSNRSLVVGTSFSLGLGIGLLLSGANRFLIAIALAPAGAVALAMFGRGQADDASDPSSPSKGRRQHGAS